MTTQPAHMFHGLEIAVRRFGGARGLRIIHPGNQHIAPHRHDWPLLTLPMLGGYQEECEDGSVAVCGPAAVLHPGGVCHANCIHPRGMETFSIEFDPAWAGLNRASLDRSYYWIGGEIPLAARSLARLWADPCADENALRRATATFLLTGTRQPEKAPPPWFDCVRERLQLGESATATELAKLLGMHPRWLAHAYRNAAGEGLHETVSRRRAECAVHLLRTTDQPLADVAAAAGFCDQSHLNRSLRRLTGRTPRQIRGERVELAALTAVQACSGERASVAC